MDENNQQNIPPQPVPPVSVPEPVQSPPPIAEPPQPKGSKGLIWTLIVIIVILLAIIVGAFYFLSDSNTPQDSGAVTPQGGDSDVQSNVFSNQSNSQAVVIPEGWNVYKNDDIGVEFSYPKGWVFVEGDSYYGYALGSLIKDDYRWTLSVYRNFDTEALDGSGKLIKYDEQKSITVDGVSLFRDLVAGDEVAATGYKLELCQEKEQEISSSSGYSAACNWHINDKGKRFSIVYRFNDSNYDRELISEMDSISKTLRVYDKEYDVPVITKISPAKGTVGTEIRIHGENLVDSRGGQNIAITKDGRGLGYLGFGDATSSAVFDENGDFLRWGYLEIRVGDKVCKDRSTDAGIPCTSWLTITPGKYDIFVDHSNSQGYHRSNKVEFEVLNDEI